jgi:hypothetical protein
LYEPSIDKDATGLSLYRKDQDPTYDDSIFKELIAKKIEDNRIREARAAREAEQKQKDDEIQQRAIFHQIDSLPNDIYAPKDDKIKAENVQKISDYVYAHPELYDTKSTGRIPAKLELDKLIFNEKDAAMKSNQWYKNYLKNDVLYNQAFADKTNPASTDDFYDYQKHKDLADEKTAGDYTLVAPNRKADIEAHISKDMQKDFDTRIKNNPNTKVGIDEVTNQFKHDLVAIPAISIRNAHDFAAEPPEVQQQYEATAKANNSNPLIEYGVDKHKETLNYLTGQYIKYAPRGQGATFAQTLPVSHEVDANGNDIYTTKFGDKGVLVPFDGKNELVTNATYNTVTDPKTNKKVVVGGTATVAKNSDENDKLLAKFNEDEKKIQERIDKYDVENRPLPEDSKEAHLQYQTKMMDFAKEKRDLYNNYKKALQVTTKPLDETQAKDLFTSTHKGNVNQMVNGVPLSGVKVIDNRAKATQNAEAQQPKTAKPTFTKIYKNSDYNGKKINVGLDANGNYYNADTGEQLK